VASDSLRPWPGPRQASRRQQLTQAQPERLRSRLWAVMSRGPSHRPRPRSQRPPTVGGAWQCALRGSFSGRFARRRGLGASSPRCHRRLPRRSTFLPGRRPGRKCCAACSISPRGGARPEAATSPRPRGFRRRSPRNPSYRRRRRRAPPGHAYPASARWHAAAARTASLARANRALFPTAKALGFSKRGPITFQEARSPV
jgi:hypothetical protein